MSRRHKEKDNVIKDNNNTNSVESQADRNPFTLFSGIELFDRFTVSKHQASNTEFSFSKTIDAIAKALADNQIVIDGQWVKLPLHVFEDEVVKLFKKLANPEAEAEEEPKKKKKGRNRLKRLFNKIADSKVVKFFQDTLGEVKKKCVELYDDMTQFSVCFLQGIHKAFAPDEDPYGKISHYHEMLKDEVMDLPSRRTISHYYNWYEKWKKIVINEQPKEKKERHKHKIWEELIEWIFGFLQRIAPEYAVQMQTG